MIAILMGGGSVVDDSLFIYVSIFVEVLCLFCFCYALLSGHSSFQIILIGSSEKAGCFI